VPAAAVAPGSAPRSESVDPRLGVAGLVLFAALLVGLPVLRALDSASQPAAIADAFYRAGSLVFGGGHVVLPLLGAETVEPGWVSPDTFLAGYGAAQAVPGPLFTFAAYLGAVSTVPPAGVTGGLLALGAIFLPSFLLVFGVLPFWDRLRASAGFRRALGGVNAAVVGLLAAALYDPVATSAIGVPIDLVLALGGLGLLAWGRVPVVAIVAGFAVAGEALARLG
jgi:chromate transporter